MTEHEMAEWDAYLDRTQPSWDEAFDAQRYDDDASDVPMSVLVFAPTHPEIDLIPAHTCDNPGVYTMCEGCITIEDSQWQHVYS